MSIKTENIKVTGPDSTFDAYLAKPAAGGPGILVIQEVFGVNAHIRDVCDRFAKAGYTALAPDIFHYLEPNVELGYEEADVMRGIGFMEQLDHPRTMRDIAATMEQLKSISSNGKVGVTGFCMGGLLTYLTATNLRPDCAAAYYGGGIANFTDQANNISCPIIFHFGEKDTFIPMADVEKIRQATSRLANCEIYTYDADHGFHCDVRASYDESSATIAWQRTLNLLSTNLA